MGTRNSAPTESGEVERGREGRRGGVGRREEGGREKGREGGKEERRVDRCVGRGREGGWVRWERGEGVRVEKKPKER